MMMRKMMTVEELIEVLKKMPQDAVVWNGSVPVTGIYHDEYNNRLYLEGE